MTNQTSWFDEDTKRAEFKELDAGKYKSTLTNVSLDETGDVEKLSIEFTLNNKRKVWMNLKFSEAQKKFANWQFRELGVYEDAKRIGQTKSAPRAFLEAITLALGNEYMLDLSYRDYNGKTYSSIKVLERLVTIGEDNDPVVKTDHVVAKKTDGLMMFDYDEEIPF